MSIAVSSTRHGHVAEIRFARPPHNFASPELLRAIADELDRADAEPEVRCSTLVAEGRSFCAGADLAGDEAIAGGDGMGAIGQLYVQAERIFRRRKPLIAVVQGAAIGAGLGLALAADFRIAGPGARFSANFTRLGFHPGFGLTHTLPRLVGEARAGWIMLSSERVKPDKALAWGLIDRLGDETTLYADGMAMAAELAANAPLAIVAVRQTLIAGLADRVAAAMQHEHAQQTMLKATADYAEGVSSVFERRDARFIGA